MRIAVMGAGGVGGYFGARLAAAGHDVAFVARGRHLAALRANGLAVKSAVGDVTVAAPGATDEPSALNDLAAGRRLEAPWLCGAVVRMASEARVATPINNAIYAALLPYCDGRRVADLEETA